MASRDVGTAGDIDLRELGRTVIRSIPRLVILSFIVGAATYGVLMMVAPRYYSESQLAIISKSSNNPYKEPSATRDGDNLAVRMDKEAINTHVRALLSSDLADTVVREMKLAERAEFNSALGPADQLTAIFNTVGLMVPRAGESEQSRVLSSYFKRLEVYAQKESRTIGIRFYSADPELSARVANKLSETYRENLTRQTIGEIDSVQKALEIKIAELAKEADAADAAVERFRGEANIFKAGQQQTGLNEQQLSELNAELSKVKAARSEAEARARQAREMLEGGNADLLADIQKSQLIQNLVQSRVRVERQVSELSATLLPGHPRMRQLNADLAGLKKQITAEVGKIVEGMTKEAKVAAMREEAVAKNLAEIKSKIVKTGPDEARLRSLEADAASKRGELERLRSQFENNRIRADDSRTVPVEAQILSTARAASIPDFPKKGPAAALASVATMLIGLALVITLALLSGPRVAYPRSRDDDRDDYHERTQAGRAEPMLRVEPSGLAEVHRSPGPAQPRDAAPAPAPSEPPAPAPKPASQQPAALARPAAATTESRDRRSDILNAARAKHPEPTLVVAPSRPVEVDQTMPQAAPMSAPVSAPIPAPMPTPVARPAVAAAAVPFEPALAAPAIDRDPAPRPHPAPAKAPPQQEVSGAFAEIANKMESVRKPGFSGVRTLLVADASQFTMADDVRAIGEELSARGLTVVIVDWDLASMGLSEALGHPMAPGLVELFKAEANFEDVVSALPNSSLHIIPSGSGKGDQGDDLDPDRINAILDALDAVYDHIVVAARAKPARALFEAMEGRFDCGITIVDEEAPAGVIPQAGTFLDFEVEGVELMTYARPGSPTNSAVRRLARTP